MTIKPVVAPTQKRVPAEEKKESHAHAHSLGHGHGHTSNSHTHPHAHAHNVVVEQSSSHNQATGRGTATHSQCRAGQSPQRRVEVYDELARHRRSPHKSIRSKRRDHHDQHKRDRTEREKHTSASNVNVSIANKCNNSHVHGAAATAAASSGVTGASGSCVVGVGGGSSPSSVGGSGKSPEHLSGLPVVLGCQSPKSSTSVAQVAANLLKAAEDTYSGYNSGDEHLQSKEGAITADEWQSRDEQFAKCMVDRGYELKPVEEDGACLFRAISLQIYGDEEMHDVVRQHTMDYICKNREYFSHFVTEDINSYIKRKRRKDSHGNHIEIQAMSEIYSRPVEVYCYKPTPINIFNSEQSNNGYAPLRLSYQRGSHYNAIIDPYDATVGVGLGLAGYKPELQTKEAVRLSEQLELEQTMFEDKLKTTDWEATNEAIEEQIARESYLQWCRENIQKSRTSTTAASTSATITSAEVASDSEASPSKYSFQHNSNSSSINSSNIKGGSSSSNSGCANNNSTITTSMTCATGNQIDHSGGIGINVPHNSVAGAAMSSAGTSLEHTFGLSPKSLNALAHNLKKNGTPPHSCDLELDSDDTDMSSNSSIGNAGGCIAGSSSPSTSMRATKTKKRVVSLRAGGKKRRREQNVSQLAICLASSEIVDGNRVVGKTSKQERNTDTPILPANAATKSRSRTPETEQLPCTSKQSTKTPEKDISLGAEQSLKERSNSPSDSLPRSAVPPLTKPVSNFYQELLEASYTTDDCGQLSESEMLQRAIQMSTRDYIEDQKRKYLYGP